MRPERGDAWTLTLEPEGHEGMRFLPGQFGWLSLGRAPWRAGEHPFSFSSAPTTSGSVDMTVTELGDFTRRIGATEVEAPPGIHCYLCGPVPMSRRAGGTPGARSTGSGGGWGPPRCWTR